MHNIKKLIPMVFLLCSPSVFAANSGYIGSISFSGSHSTWGAGHRNIVQFTIIGGFDAPGCDPTYAGIRKDESILIEGLLQAKAQNKEVTVQLDDGDTYYDGTRCIITDLFFF